MQKRVTRADSPQPAGLRDIPRAAWILSRAFAATSLVGRHLQAPALARIHALAPFPVFLSLTLSCTIARQVYLDDARVGVVIFGPGRSVREVVGWICTCFALIVVLTPVATIAFIPNALVILLIYATALLWVILALEVMWPGHLSKAARRERRRNRKKVPRGPRWRLTFLGKIPGVGVNASRLAHRVLLTVPPAGAIVIVHPRTQELHRQYEKYGFTPTRGQGMYFAVPTAQNLRTAKASCPDSDGESR